MTSRWTVLARTARCPGAEGATLIALGGTPTEPVGQASTDTTRRVSAAARHSVVGKRKFCGDCREHTPLAELPPKFCERCGTQLAKPMPQYRFCGDCSPSWKRRPKMPRHPGRSGAAWRRVRAEVLAESSVCYVCGRPIDFNARPRSRWSPSVDHLLPISAFAGLDDETQRKMALDKANLRACHYGCNSRKGARFGTVRHAPRRSRNW